MLEEIRHVAFISVSMKGRKLSSVGSISVISVKAAGALYLLDIEILGSSAFHIKFHGVSLASILSSKYIKKGIYDCRNAANALHGLFGIRLRGVLDIQLFHLATLPSQERKYLPGLDAALQKHQILSEESNATLKDSREIFASVYVDAKGGDETRLSDRPINDILVAYASLDVYFLEQLYDASILSLDTNWLSSIRKETSYRLEMASSKTYQPWSKKMRFGPRSWIIWVFQLILKWYVRWQDCPA